MTEPADTAPADTEPVDTAPAEPGTAPEADDGLHPNAVAVRRAAAMLGLSVEVRTYPAGTRTAADAAAAIGCDVGQIVKSLVFLVDGVLTMALVSGSNQLDEAKLAAAAGGQRTSRADANQVREATGYAIGGVPPFGHRHPLPVYVDPDLLQYQKVWAAAGTPTAVFGVHPQELLDAIGAPTADLRRG
ncbi:MAG: YbaK/EbsC family protein [Acidimicrobiales bacterium]